MDGLLLAIGILLGLIFSGVLVFKVFPPLDHIVKKQFGPAEACLFTRLCPMIVGLPFYVFTIWMTLVILVKPEKANSVVREICGDDYECTRHFALGRNQFDKEACLSADCGDANLQARSGSKPLHFPRLGLGREFSPTYETLEFECLEIKNGTCIEAVLDGEVCSCVGEHEFDSVPLDCEAVSGCFNDIADAKRDSTCLIETDCTEWSVTTDSDKQFAFHSCSCKGEDCSEFTCEALTMQYFYPNVFFAGAATILFVLPTMIVTYVIAKTHLRKIIKCGEMKMFVYSQEAGLQNEYQADNLATGGFNNEQEQKEKYRTFSTKDVLALIGGPIIMFFFSYLIVMVSGRVGLAFVCLAASLIAAVEIYNFVKLINKQNADLQDRIKTNNPEL